MNDAGIDSLTPREREVLVYLCKGFSSKQIGAYLGIKWRTVVDHTKAIFKKLDVGSRPEAAVIAAKAGVV